MSRRHILRLPTPFPLQAEIISHPARFKVVATGRRFGKTTLGILLVVEMALRWEGVYWWVAPTYQIASIAWERLRALLGGCSRVSEVHRRLDLPHGARIQCVSAQEPDHLRGEGVTFLVLDEAAYIPRLDYVWHAILRPMLLDNAGSLLALSTPNRRNLFFTWYALGQGEPSGEWKSWSAPTMANPFLPRAELDAVLADYPEGSLLYRQEILGEFVEGEGAVFRNVRAAACGAALDGAEPGRVYVAGVDFGMAQDYTVAVVFDVEARRMVALDRFRGLEYTLQRARLRALHERWRPRSWFVEGNAAGKPNIELLRAVGLPVIEFTTTAASKRQIVERLALALDAGQIQLLNDPRLILEFEAFERHVNSATGIPSYRAAEGAHDDIVMATAIAWYGVHRPSLVAFEV